MMAALSTTRDEIRAKLFGMDHIPSDCVAFHRPCSKREQSHPFESGGRCTQILVDDEFIFEGNFATHGEAQTQKSSSVKGPSGDSAYIQRPGVKQQQNSDVVSPT
jgi:hypothetical protein